MAAPVIGGPPIREPCRAAARRRADQVQDQQHDVADVEAGDQAPDEVGRGVEERRPRLEAVLLEGGEHDRCGRRGRQAEGEERRQHAGGLSAGDFMLPGALRSLDDDTDDVTDAFQKTRDVHTAALRSRHRTWRDPDEGPRRFLSGTPEPIGQRKPIEIQGKAATMTSPIRSAIM
jgi:hypothetical protein